MPEDHTSQTPSLKRNLDDPGKPDKKNSGKWLKGLIARHPWVVNAVICVILGIVFGFFGFNYQKVKGFFGLTRPPRPENTTIGYSLADEIDVSNKQGTAHITGNNDFEEGGCGSKGFVSIEKGDVITFQVPSQFLYLDSEFLYLDEGTVALCVTPKDVLRKEKENFSLFRIHNATKNVSLKVRVAEDGSGGFKPTELRFRLQAYPKTPYEPKGGNLNRTSNIAAKVNWKAGSHYHVAATWGVDGMKLYIDGEPLAGNNIVEVPKDFKEKRLKKGMFVVNNQFSNTDEDEDEEFTRPTNWIVSNLQISNYQKSHAAVKQGYEALHPTE